jgi:DNA-binding transcriptional regulator YbjK
VRVTSGFGVPKPAEYGDSVVRAAPGNRRTDILDAAINLVAGAGLRGLTHRAVDAAVGLPEGSTSAYFRTRAALLTALVVRLGERIGADVDELAAELAGHPCDASRAVELTMTLLDGWLRDPAPLAARLELSLESTRRPELGEAMSAWREGFEALVTRIIADFGLTSAPDHAALLVACIDGLLFRAITATPVTDHPPVIDPASRAAVVEQARTLLTALMIGAHYLETSEGDPLGSIPGAFAPPGRPDLGGPRPRPDRDGSLPEA